MTPSDSAADDVLAIAAAAYEVSDERQWWDRVVETVQGSLFHAEVMTVVNFVSGQGVAPAGWFGTIHALDDACPVLSGSTLPRPLVHEHPFSWSREPAIAGPVQVTDLLSERQWRNLSGRSWLRENFGATHHLTIPVRTGDLQIEALSIWRAESAFNDDEMKRAIQLQSVLRLCLTHLRHLESINSGSSAHHRAHGDHAARALGITDRERVILELVAKALPTNHVARELGISPRTVYKHQENVYRKLGANDRMTALNRARTFRLVT